MNEYFESPDFTEAFNTELTPEEEANFKIWLLEEFERSGKDRLRDMRDYDIKGFFKAGEAMDGRGHGTDRFKKPSHPTFSNESIYHGAPTPDGRGVFLGGEWGRKDNHDTYRPHPRMFINKTHNPEHLKSYFIEAEDGNELLWD